MSSHCIFVQMKERYSRQVFPQGTWPTAWVLGYLPPFSLSKHSVLAFPIGFQTRIYLPHSLKTIFLDTRWTSTDSPRAQFPFPLFDEITSGSRWLHPRNGFCSSYYWPTEETLTLLITLSFKWSSPGLCDTRHSWILPPTLSPLFSVSLAEASSSKPSLL